VQFLFGFLLDCVILYQENFDTGDNCGVKGLMDSGFEVRKERTDQQ
jgi:hypothetical protein